MQVLLSIFFTTFLLFQTITVSASETLVLYDDFKGLQINPEKWFGFEVGSSTEAIRKTQFRHLRLFQRTYGSTNSDIGFQTGRLGLGFTRPNDIKAIQAKLKVRRFEVNACTPGIPNTWARVRLLGVFFNTNNQQPGTGDLTDDLVAYIGLTRKSEHDDPLGLLRIVGSIWICRNARCLLPEDLDSVYFQEFDTIKVHEQVQLGIEYDADANADGKFTFSWNHQSVEFELPNWARATGLPGRSAKNLQVTQRGTNCIDEIRSTASTDAIFNAVYVNASAITPELTE